MNKDAIAARVGCTPPGRSPWSRLLPPLVGLLLVGIAAFVLIHLAEVQTWLLALRTWTEARGSWAPVVFACVYAVGVVCFVPGNLMTPLAAAMFGPLVAVPVVSVGGTLGAVIAFLIARHALRDAVSARLSRNARFRWLEDRTAERGPLFVAVTRILPVLPANVIHYAFGVTRVSARDFVFWSWICSLPGLILFVTGLDVVFRLLASQSLPPTLLLALAGIVLVKAGLIAWAARMARCPRG